MSISPPRQRPRPRPRPMQRPRLTRATEPLGGGASGEVSVKEEEEETLGQLRDRLGLVPGLARVPGTRAAFVHIKVEHSTTGEDTDGEGGGEGGKEAAGGEGDGEEEEKEEGEEAEEDDERGQQLVHHSQLSGANFSGRMEAAVDTVEPPRRARPPPESYADPAVERDPDDDYGEEDEEEWGGEDEEEEKEEAEPRDQCVHVTASSRKGGIDAVRPQSLPLGAHSEPGSQWARLRAPGRVNDSPVPPEEEEEDAGCAPELKKRGGGPDHAGSTSRFMGVSWCKIRGKWKAACKGKHLGLHTTEEVAARAYNTYLKDSGAPEPTTSQFKGVSWNKCNNRWVAHCKRTRLGLYNTEEDAARAYSKYLEDGIDPVQHRNATCSHFTGVVWDKDRSKWAAKCKGKRLGRFTTEESAARAYNVEAQRLGLALNIIKPVEGVGAVTVAGACTGPSAGGGASPKRAAPKTLAAPTTNKKTKRAAPTTPA